MEGRVEGETPWSEQEIAVASSHPIHETNIDGVPVFWVDQPGPIQSSLLFRVGCADEFLPQRGLTHAVEHLALSRLSHVDYPFNGHVDELFTWFTITGSAAEVTSHLQQVVGSLGNLEVGRLAAERRVLLTEASSRASSMVGELLIQRFGATGVAKAAFGEMGVRGLTETQLGQWSELHFTGGNAALWLTCAPPADLRLALPPGPPVPAPASTPVDVPVPLVAERVAGGIGVGTTVECERATELSISILAQSLRSKLRDELALTYSIRDVITSIDSRTVHLTLMADVLPEHSNSLFLNLEDLFSSIRRDGVSDGDMKRAVARAARQAADPRLLPLVLSAAARRKLLGVGSARAEQEHDLEQIRSAVTALCNRFLSKGIWIVPRGTAIPRERYHVEEELPRDSEVFGEIFTPMRGTGFRRLSMTSRAISFVLGPKRVVTISADRLAAVRRWETGQWTLLTNDGFQLLVDPLDWSASDRLATALEKFIPADLIALCGPWTGARQPRPTARWARTFATTNQLVLVAMFLGFWAVAFWWNAAVQPGDKVAIVLGSSFSAALTVVLCVLCVRFVGNRLRRMKLVHG